MSAQKVIIGTAAQWTSIDQILLAGYLGMESDTGKSKIGDGVTRWKLLGYEGVVIGSDVQAWSALLDATTASFLAADRSKLDGLACLVGTAAGVLIKIAASGAPNDLFQVLAAGSADALRIDDTLGTVGIGVAPGSRSLSVGDMSIVQTDPASTIVNLGAAGTIPATIDSIRTSLSCTGRLIGHRVQQDGNGTAEFYAYAAGTGDPIFRCSTTTQAWTLGQDNSDGDKFKIDSETSLTTSAHFAITTAGEVGIGDDSPSDLFHVACTPSNSGLRLDDTLGTAAIGVAPISGVALAIDGDVQIKESYYDGHLGIGVAPSSSKSLYVRGDTQLHSRDPSDTILSVGGDGTKPANVDLIKMVLNNTGYARCSLWQVGDGGAPMMTVVQGTGDPYFVSKIYGGATWSFGADNSDGDKFKIEPLDGLTTSAPFAITTAGEVGIGDDSPSDLFHVETAAGIGIRVDDATGHVGIGAAPSLGTYGHALKCYGMGLNVTRVDPRNGEPIVQVVVNGTIPNTVTAFQANASCDKLEMVLQQNGAGRARYEARVAGAGDAYFLATISGGQEWSFGLDNSDGDRFKIDPSDRVTTSAPFAITTAGKVLIGTTTDDGHRLAVSNAAATSVPAVEIEQLDDDEPFIDFVGTSAASVAKSISTWTGATILGFVRVEINGTDRWMPFYGDPADPGGD